MGKNFKAKLTAKFLIALLVVQAALFAFTAFAETAPSSVTIKMGNTDVSGQTLVGFIGVPIALVATPDTTVTTAAYRVNFWHSTNTTAIPVPTGTTAAKSFNPAAKANGVVLSVFNTTDSSGPTKTVTVNVYRKLTSFTILDGGKLTVKVGQAGYIKEPTLVPTDADVTSTVYSLSPAEVTRGVIKINTTDGTNTVAGAVYGVKSGASSVIVTKTLPGGTTIAKTFTVTVPEPVKTLAISTDGRNAAAGTTLGINAGKRTTLKTVLTSLTGITKVPTDKKVVWSKVSGDPKISIDANTGLITLTDMTDAAIGQSAVISATANDTWNSAADTITVTVGKELKSLSVTQSTYLMKAGDTKTIIPVLKSPNATAPSVTSVTYVAETGKTAILTVDKDTGVITAVSAPDDQKPVKITVTATAADGTVKTTIVTAYVVAKVTAIELKQPTTTTALKPMKLYSKTSIASTITPKGLKLNAVRYSSSDVTVAFVNKLTGEITATGVGHATITASADTKTSNAIDVYVTDPDGLLNP